ncbi:type VII secretion integral membrane protein EccD [uncultured Nocardioides sp.]|uniref:type VII secretion integral membrane protein EccD n=2 Tax=uncultured Nocardioides sp. TaxID=198441 RepID=UPI00262D8455|nr:type VII secretion integral membrane protein EccD [uncultured Nocardioides sp.]
MSTAPPSAGPAPLSGLVRVTVASGSRRVDLVLPGAVPVAELVPELARSVGLLDPLTVHGGYTVTGPDGRRLSGDAGLVLQGVEDGALLTVSAGVDAEPPRVYDDVVEAMTDVVERDLRPWSPASGRRTALGAAGLLLVLGAGSLLVQTDSTLAGTAAALVAAALLAGSVVLSRIQGEPEAAVAVSWTASLYAVVAGLLLAADGGFGPSAVGAGLGAVLVGALSLLAVGEGRALTLPPAAVGAVFLVTGLVLADTDLDPAVVLVALLVLLVLLGSVFPWWALSLTGRGVEQAYSLDDLTADPDEIDAAAVGADARLAHEALLAIGATVGLLLVTVSPLAVGRGLSGTLLALVCAVVLMLRTRQYRTGTEVLVGLLSGVLGLVSTAAAVLVLHPDWRPTTAVVLAATGGVLLALTLVPAPPSVRRGRLGDVAETVALLALLPLAVVACGLFAAIVG